MKNRDIWPLLKKQLASKEVMVITGPRQVGKTTTLRWLLSQISSANKYYFDFENIANRDLFSVKNYDSIFAEFSRLGLDTSEKLYIAIDEIQHMPQLPSIIKYLYDHYNIKFIITGSSSYYLKNLFSESMAGRKVIFELYPLSFAEFIRFKGEEYQLPSFAWDSEFSSFSYEKLTRWYKEYIEYGGLPRVVLEPHAQDKKRALEMIFSSYIQLDVQTLSDFRSIKEFRSLVQLLAGRIGNKINISALANTLGISRQTVHSYLTFMQQTYLIRLIEPFSKSADVKVRVTPKLYFVDTGIANINYDLSAGAKFENTICHQLYLNANTHAFGRHLNYFASDTREIDFILNNDTAFEVKETPLGKDLKKLERNATKIGISQFRLIGKQKPSGFDDFLWGGSININPKH